MSNVVLVLGRSGMGKSTSIRNLDYKSTCIINVLGKKLPFKGADTKYIKNKNLFHIENWEKVKDILEKINKNGPHVKNIVIDDATFIMRKEYYDRAKETGFNKFVEMAQHMKSIINTCEGMRDDLNIFMLWHTEQVVSDNIIVGHKASTIGKMMDSTYNPSEIASIVLFAETKFDEKGEPIYGFYTKLRKDGVVELPAKTPDGMFEEDFIPNDLALVVKAIDEYYGKKEASNKEAAA